MPNRFLRDRLLPAAAAIGAVVCATQPAAAYIGPGAGVSMVGALVGLLVAFVMAAGIVLFWPVRVLVRRLRGGSPASAQAPDGATLGRVAGPDLGAAAADRSE